MNIEYFFTIKDLDIFENPLPEPKEYKVRPTAKGIVLDSSNAIAIISNGEHSLFPGGGVDEGETFEQAFVRECMEEIGCNVKIIKSLGKALQSRAKNNLQYEVEFFIAEVIGEKGKPTTTQEGELSCVLYWLEPQEILKILQDQIPHIRADDYPAHFNCRTHLAVFEKYLKEK